MSTRTASWLFLGLALSFSAAACDRFRETRPVSPTEPRLSVANQEQQALDDRYIVVLQPTLKGEAATRAVDELAAMVKGPIIHRYAKLLSGFAIKLEREEVELLSRDPRVSHLAPDVPVEVDDTDYNAGWGVGRIDQRAGPSDYQFDYDTAGQSAVNVYIIDSGIDGSHSDFTGRVYAGFTYDAGKPALSDCAGHGTAVASVAAGTEYGVAKRAKIWSVRIDDCSSPASRSDIIAGLEWVAVNHVQPAVANLSYSLPGWLDGLLPGSVHNAAVNLQAAGVFLTVSAGNDSEDACGWSPGNAAELMTVGATDSTDAKASFTNYGACVDIYAPGAVLPAAVSGGSFTYKSGTSFSAPMTAGVAALYLAKYPTDSNNDVHYAIRDGATTGVIGMPAEILLYSRLPAPVRVFIDGPSVVPPGAFCSWSSVIRAGRRPFTISWSGAFSGSISGVSGSLSTSDWLVVQVWDALGGTANDLLYVTVDPSMSGMIICP